MTKKSSTRIGDKMSGIMLGIALTLSAIGIISSISISSAHTSPSSIVDDSMQGMMGDQSGMMSSDMMRMMHSMMTDDMMDGNAMDSNGMMGCMSMMKNNEMTQEEIDEMLKSMDKDGDGQCDMCGMSIEMCRKMMSP